MATQADLDALLAMRNSGVLSTRFADGRMVVYRSMAELNQAIAAVRVEMTSAPLMRTTRTTFERD